MQPSTSSARVLLAEPEVLETWAKTTQHNIKGQKVTISPSNTEGLLCLARLPQDYSEEDFFALVSSLGDANYCFLMRSEKSGESKGYGFIEYVNKEVANQAKAALDGRELRDSTLVCDWLDPCHVTFASLHSTCLYVDCLPKDYRDMGEFRRIFSKVTNPPYCQIAMKQGAIQDWGLIEYISAEDAEQTRTLLNGYKLKGQPIRVSYYVPGVRAINIYIKLINDYGMKKRGALLPEPPSNKVFNQLRNLTKHNPAFAKSLQNIILTQIQSLQQRGVMPPTSMGGDGAPQNGGQVSPVLKEGRILGPPLPNLPMALHIPPHFASPPMAQLNPLPPDQTLNGNAQAALVILLAAQLQQQQEQQQHIAAEQHQQQLCAQQNGTSSHNGNNLLSNPQVLNLLQTLVSQGDPQQKSKSSPPPPPVAVSLPQHPSRNGFAPSSSANNIINSSTSNILSNSLKNNFRSGYFKNGTSKLPKGPLLPTPATSSANGFDEGPLELENGIVDHPILNDLLSGGGGRVVENPTDDLNSSIANLLSNPNTLQHLLGSLNPEAPSPPLISPIAPSPTSMVPIHHPHHPHALIATPPLLQPPADSLMTFLRPPEFISPIDPSAHPPPFMFAPPPRINPPPHHHQSQPMLGAVFAPAGVPPLPQRLFSPVYYTRNLAGPPTPSMLPMPLRLGGYSTPIGQKRKSSHFLPSPEPSPEHGYIGQHSQGLGGHYQDSYKKKKRNT